MRKRNAMGCRYTAAVLAPADLVVREAHAFLAGALEGRRRILEVGCGTGALARALAASNFEVTAIDRTISPLLRVAGARSTEPHVDFVERDFFAFEARPFDAVVFTASLHHIAPLGDAAAKARSLVAQGGLVIADEFDIASPDRETVRWYYETQELLAASGVLAADRVDAPNTDLLERWRAAHEDGLHTGQQMRQALAALGSFSAAPAPYLYRTICGGLADTDAGSRVAANVLATEQSRIREGSIVAVGVRIVVTV